MLLFIHYGDKGIACVGRNPLIGGVSDTFNETSHNDVILGIPHSRPHTIAYSPLETSVNSFSLALNKLQDSELLKGERMPLETLAHPQGQNK